MTPDTLYVESIDNVVPLDRQFGVSPKKTVPDGLREVLFGHPFWKQKAEITPESGDPASQMHTYAILDASKVANLPELLSESRLEHRCLFKGKAYEELKDAAPWIVRLEEGNDFVRKLFTGPEGINGLWDTEPGIYVRSRGTMEDVWTHLRKLYRIRSATGQKDSYLRFWAPETLRMLLPIFRRSRVHTAAFFSTVINSVLWRRPNRSSFTQLAVRGSLDAPVGIRLDASIESRFARASVAQRILRLLRDAEAEILNKDPHTAIAMRGIPDSRKLCHALRIDRLGIRSHNTAAALLSIIYLTGMNILQKPAFHYATRNPFLAPEAKARQLLLAYVMIAKMSKEE